MKGTILDFLNLVVEKPELAKELGEMAGRYDFEFSDTVSDEQLEEVVGGTFGLARGTAPIPPDDSVAAEARRGAEAAKDLWRRAQALLEEIADRTQQNEQDLTRI